MRIFLHYFLPITVIYFVGYVRGSYHMLKCKEGRCSVPWCKNRAK